MGNLFGKCLQSTNSTNQSSELGKKQKTEKPVPKQTQNPQPQKDRVTDSDRAVLDVKARIKKVKVYIDKINLQVTDQDAKIKDLLKKKQKERALIALKHKKFLQKELDKAEGAQQMLQQTISNIESAYLDIEVMQALKQGDKVLTELQSKASLEDFEELYEKHQEHKERMEMEQDLFGQVLDDDELLDELEKLDAESIPAVRSDMIEVEYKQPVKKAKAEEQEEEEEQVSPQKRQLVAA